MAIISLIIRIALGLIVLNHFISPCLAIHAVRRGKHDTKGYNDPGKPKSLFGTSPGFPGMHHTRRGLGLTAWGIVGLIITLILAGTGFYYFSMCYPILCKKERKYDMIHLDTV